MIDKKKFLGGTTNTNTTDQSKKLDLNVNNSQTANTTATIESNVTANRTITLPDATTTLVGNNATQTLVNKTIDADQNSITNIENADIKALAAIDASKIADGSVSNAEYQYLSNVTSDIQTQLNSKSNSTDLSTHAGLTTTHGVSGTIVGTSDTQTLSNKTLSNTTILNIKDGNLVIEDLTDSTKKLKFNAAGSTNTTTTINTTQTSNILIDLPNASTTLVGQDNQQALYNKTLEDASIVIFDSTDATKQIDFNAGGTSSTKTTIAANQTANRVVTLPDATTTLVGTDTAQTLSNKTLTAPALGDATGSSLAIGEALNASSIVDIASTTKGFLGPRMTGTQRDAISSPASGLQVYNTTTNKLNVYNGSSWVEVGSGSGGASTFTATAGETLTAGQAVYIASSSDTGRTAGQAYKLDASNANRIEYCGIVTTGASAAGTATITTAGQITGLSSLTAGQPVFASVSTPGAFQLSAPVANGHFIIQVGMADSTTSMIINGGLSSTAMQITNAATPNTIVGIKNFIPYGNFENNSTTGWSLFNTTLTSLIPTGSITAGAASVTTFATTSSALSGSYSLQVGSSGAWSAGQGIISDAFAVDVASQAKVLSFKFDYRVDSGASNLNLSGTSSNTHAIYLYDVTNSAWIQPAGVYSFNQSSGSAFAQGSFQVPSNTLSMRIAILAVNASSGSVSMTMDNFFLGPQSVSYGAPVTDWQSYTPTGSWSTNTTYSGKWRRVGDTAEIELRVDTSGTNAHGNLTINLPSGLVIDTTKLSGGTLTYHALGVANASDSGAGYNLQPVYNSTTSILMLYQSSASGVQSGVSATTPFTWNTGDYLTAKIYAPIAGWSSSVVMSSDAATNEVSMKAVATPTGTLTTSFNDVVIGTVTKDTNASYATGTGIYTIPVAGTYVVLGQIGVDGTYALNGDLRLQVVHNGSTVNLGWTRAGGAVNFLITNVNATVVNAKAGDTIKLQAYTTATGASYDSAASLNYFQVYRLASPAQIAASETVGMSALANGNTITHVSNSNITTYTKDFDTHGAFNASTGIFTVPVSGIYLINGSVGVTGETAATTINARIVKNSSVVRENIIRQTESIFGNPTTTVNATLKLIAGDTVNLGVYFNSVSATNRNTVNTYLHITKLGN